MGIPGLFSDIIKTYNNTDTKIIKKYIENDLPNHFYLDFNCAIYQVIKPEIKNEDTLILYVVEYLESLCKIIPNLELIYIAMDGAVNAAKQKQQRDRRFHSICRKNRINKINQSVGSDIDKTSINNNIDTNCISPGTVFMYNLSIAIKHAIKNSDVFKNKTIIFSDSSLPNEGEHKILQHIKLAKHLAIDGTEKECNLYGVEHNTIIYGMDSDLIMLSLIADQSNTYLFREANEYGNLASIYEGKKFLFMDIDGLSFAIINSFKQYHPNICDDMRLKQRFIDDYVFLSMILGNDFMPKNHWYSIYEGGINRIFSAYFQVHNHTEKFIVDSSSLQINTEMLCDVLFIIKSSEQEAIGKLFEKRKKARIYTKPDMSERERQQMITDFYPLQHLYVEQAIEPNKPNWHSRYYKICFNMEYTPENLSLVSQTYLKTLLWNFLYYFDSECPSYTHYYPFPYSPTFSDVYDELAKHKNINLSSTNKLFQFGKSEPIDQQTLLFMILPKTSHHLIVKDAAHKLLDPKCPMNIYFPKQYGLNVAFHRYYHECTPIIYKMDLIKVKKFMKECKFTEDELKRNIQGDLFIINKC